MKNSGSLSQDKFLSSVLPWVTGFSYSKRNVANTVRDSEQCGLMKTYLTNTRQTSKPDLKGTEDIHWEEILKAEF